MTLSTSEILERAAALIEPDGASAISNAAYSADCAAFRDGTTFTPLYIEASEVCQHAPGHPLLPAQQMWPQQLAHEPEMARYLLRNYAAQDRVMRKRKPHADVVESVDTAGSNPAAERRAGSNPAVGTHTVAALRAAAREATT